MFNVCPVAHHESRLGEGMIIQMPNCAKLPFSLLDEAKYHLIAVGAYSVSSADGMVPWCLALIASYS